ncbi:MAG: glycoside hydrolase family 92 protein [Candidatus Lokiarchaeota archaeon]|nr:glycoside hydrolase family 92 protein [Candidatus Lokiarchaeota archaeon]
MRFGYSPPDSIARFTANGFILRDENKDIEIKYVDLVRVTIDTTDQGPWLPDCFWVLTHEGGREIIIENDDPCAVILLGALQKALPGFDNDAVIKAMASTDYNSFPAWDKGKSWKE